jgi:plasmid stability protein
MTNLTISLDESIVRGARIRAIQEGTSVSAKVREYLASYANVSATPSLPAGSAFLEVAKKSKANTKGAKWSRADAYDRVFPGDAGA